MLKSKFSKSIFIFISALISILFIQSIVVQKTHTHSNNHSIRNNNNASYISSPASYSGEDFTSLNNKIFEVYQEPNGFQTSINSSLDIPKIVAMKISGFPKNKNNKTIISEIEIKDKSNNQISPKVAYLNKGPSLNVDITTGDENNEYNLFDGNFIGHGLTLYQNSVVDSSQIETEINLRFDTATDISSIKLAIDKSAASTNVVGQNPWAKIGAIELLDEDGTVYRKEGLKLRDFSIGITDDASDLNFDLSAKEIKWDLFDKKALNKDVAFMYSYASPNSYLSLNAPFFFKSKKEYRSITPIYSLKNEYIWTYDIQDSDSSTQVKSNFLKNISSTPNQDLEMLKKFSDSGLWNSLKSTTNLKTVDLEQISRHSLENYDTNVRKSISKTNPELWNLSLTFNGDANTIDSYDLSLLQYFKNFKNINSFSIRSKKETLYNLIPLDISSADWVSSWKHIENIRFLNDKSPFSIGASFNHLEMNGELSECGFFSKIDSLKTLDLSALVNKNIENELFLEWFSNLSKNIEVYLPIPFINKQQTSLIKKQIDKLEEVFKISSVKGHAGASNNDWLKLVKISGITLPRPKVVLDSTNTKNVLQEILVNDIPIYAKIYSGIIDWDFTGTGIKLEDVVWQGANNHFYTEDYKRQNTITTQLKDIIPRFKNTTINTTPPFTYKNMGKLTILNYKKKDQTINIDEKKIHNKLYKSNLFWNFDSRKIKYGYFSNNEAHYFTSLDTLLSSLNNDKTKIATYNVFSYVPNVNESHNYFTWKNVKFNLPEPDLKNQGSSVNIDDQKITGIFIYKSVKTWRFPNLEDVQYYNSITKKYYTAVYDIKNHKLRTNLTSLEKPVIDKNKNKIELNPVTDLGFLKSLTTLQKEIKIDGSRYRSVLRNGEMFWDFVISDIKYASRTYDALGVDTGIEYYTDYSHVPQINIYSKNFYSIQKANSRAVPNLEYVLDPAADLKYLASINIDGKSFSSEFVNGKWIWSVPIALLDSISYKDGVNSYYSNLSSIDPKAIPNLFISSVDNTKITKIPNNIVKETMPKFPMELNNTNKLWFDKGFSFRGRIYQYIIKDSVVYIPPNLSYLMHFYSKSGTRYYSFYSDLADIKDQKLILSLNSFYVDEKNDDIDTFIAKPLVDPNLKDDAKGINVVSSNNLSSFIPLINRNGRKYYEDKLGIISTIKYQHGSVYYASLDSETLNLDTAKDIVTVNPLSIDKIIFDVENDLEPIIRKNNDIAVSIGYGFISISGSTMLLVILNIVFRKIKRGRL